jgi:hypothetical protein
VLLVLLFTTLTGCGRPNCQNTCQYIYGDGNQNIEGELVNNCGIPRPGRSTSELLTDCLVYCEDALDQPGELGNYDPYTRQGSDVSIEIDNEAQAAVWMECVTASDCERLEEGYCAPIW